MCPSCKAAEETKGLWRQFNSPQCLWCSARLIQQLGKLPITASEVTARRRAVLQDAIAWGHSEARLRVLAKGPLALEGSGK